LSLLVIRRIFPLPRSNPVLSRRHKGYEYKADDESRACEKDVYGNRVIVEWAVG
jgi:hypothetical protein